MTTPQHPQDFDSLRIVHKRVNSSSVVPPLDIPEKAADEGVFKNELVVNSFTSTDGVGAAPGIYMRVGDNVKEVSGDKLIRLGPALVTNDPTNISTPTIPYSAEISDFLETGTLWLRKTDGAFFVHDGSSYFRVTPIASTVTDAGIIRTATNAEVQIGTVNNAAVTPSSLSNWATQTEILTRQHQGRVIFVDQSIGNDSLENDGLDPRTAYQTISRALIEVARQSFVAGLNNDVTNYYTISVAPGRYMLDNRPGVNNYINITRQVSEAKGPINPSTLENTVTAVAVNSDGDTVLTVDGADIALIDNFTQVWNGITDTSATGIVKSVSNTEVILTRVSGTWAISDSVLYPDYSTFNSTLGGVIVPRGCSVVGIDLRRCIVEPKYVGDFAAWEASITGCTCNYVGGTSRFKLTGSSYFANMTMVDNPNIKSTHHLCTAFEFASTLDLSDAAYGYYLKVYQGLGNTVSPNIISGEFQKGNYESDIVSPALNNSVTDPDGFRLVDTVNGQSPYISNVSLLSRFGARGLRIDGGVVGGFKSFVVERFTNVSLQNDERAFEAAADAPADKKYREVWKHASYEALNDGYAQLVSCFTIASADHYRTRSGGTFSLANCFVNFGDVGFRADGFSSNILGVDANISTLKLVPPKPINSPTQELPLGTFKPYSVEGSPVTDRLYTYEDSLDEARLDPFRLIGGEQVYIRLPSGAEFTANLVDNAPFFQQDTNGWYINVKTDGNTISTETENNLDSLVIFIRRNPDLRIAEDRIYWLRLEGVVEPKRQPQRNFVVRFNNNNVDDLTMEEVLFIADIRTQDSSGNSLGAGVYEIALLSGQGTNDPIGLLFPEIDIDEPSALAPTSRSYIAMNSFLQSLGLSETQRTTLLGASNSAVDLINPATSSAQTYYLDFAAPSTIRAFGTGIEWIGYLNYSSSIPKYQDHNFTLPELLLKIKYETDGGRVYNVGMTEEGLFVVGDQVIDLRNGEETDLSNPFQEQNKVYKNLTVTNRLFMYPQSTLDLNGTTINFDTNSTFGRTILPTFSTYANTTRGGFVRFATQTEANALTADNVVIAPSTIPIASETQQGIARFSTQAEADALTSTDTFISPSTIPQTSETQKGIIEVATQAEADALTDNTKAITPANLPETSETQKGIIEVATQVEADALADNTKAITPANLPEATKTQKGIVQFATDEQAATFVDDNITINPSQLRDLIRLNNEGVIGAVQMFAGDTAPIGWLFCRGQAISRVDYQKLFGVIGTKWGAGDNVNTFNLPPAQRVPIAASGSLNFTCGDIGGSSTTTNTSVAGGSHSHTATTSLNGAFTPTVTIVAGGEHTPVITVVNDLGHNHILQVVANSGLIPTGTILPAGAHTPVVTVLSDGAHAHTTTLANAGAYTPTGTVQPGGGYTPVISVITDGSHIHGVTLTPYGPYTFTAIGTSAAGGHTPSVSINTGGEHTHSITIVENGEHNHVLEGGFGVGGGGGATAYADAATDGMHTHTGSANSGAGHTHSTNVNAIADHTHVVNTFQLPQHNHTVTVATGGGHTHGLNITPVDSHSHGLVIDPIPSHTHVATTATAGDHTHNLVIAEVSNHVHLLTMDAIPAHSHTGDTTTDGSHAHDLVINQVAAHTHDTVVSDIPDHQHTLTTTVEPAHTHDTTSSTMQPYAVFNFIIYTGVFV